MKDPATLSVFENVIPLLIVASTVADVPPNGITHESPAAGADVNGAVTKNPVPMQIRFRAAAIDQLKIWGQRVGADVIAREAGADSAGLVFEAVTTASGRKLVLLGRNTDGPEDDVHLQPPRHVRHIDRHRDRLRGAESGSTQDTILRNQNQRPRAGR